VFFNLPSSSEKNHEERIFKEDSTLATLLVGRFVRPDDIGKFRDAKTHKRRR
jgi:hypothetical protein